MTGLWNKGIKNGLSVILGGGVVFSFPENRHPTEGRGPVRTNVSNRVAGDVLRAKRATHYLLSATQVFASLSLGPGLRRDDDLLSATLIST